MLLVLLAQPWHTDGMRDLSEGEGQLLLPMTVEHHNANLASFSTASTPPPVTVPVDKKLQVSSLLYV